MFTRDYEFREYPWPFVLYTSCRPSSEGSSSGMVEVVLLDWESKSYGVVKGDVW